MDWKKYETPPNLCLKGPRIRQKNLIQDLDIASLKCELCNTASPIGGQLKGQKE
jgi:hypothetical protein